MKYNSGKIKSEEELHPPKKRNAINHCFSRLILWFMRLFKISKKKKGYKNVIEIK